MELTFGAEFEEDCYQFLDVKSEEYLNKILSGEVKLELVSDGHSPAIICSESETFQLLDFDTSNTLLLRDGPTILSRQFSVIEFRPSAPPFLQLRQLLHSNPITEQEIRGAPLANPIFYDSLFDVTLCSRREFDALLERLCAISIDGALKTPPPELQILITDEIIKYAMTLPEWRTIHIDTFLNRLAIPLIECPIMQNLVLAVLKCYSSETSETHAILDETKIMRFVAESVLKRARNGIMRDRDFVSEMEGQLPPALKLIRESLFGICVYDKGTVKYIDEEALPIALEERLNAVFALHKQWEARAMEPLFEFFVTSELRFGDFIARYARFVDGCWMKR
jgi:hypothetical protein